MKLVLDLTLLDGPSVQDWMDDESAYTAVRVPPGVELTPAQYQEWLRLRARGTQAHDRYAAQVARDAAEGKAHPR